MTRLARAFLAGGSAFAMCVVPPVASSRSDQRQIGSWSKVLELDAGSGVRVTVAGDLSIQGKLLAVDDVSITIAAFDGQAKTLESACAELISSKPSQLAAASRGEISCGANVRIGPGGAFVGSRRVGSAVDVVRRIERPNVIEVRARKTQAWKVGLAAILGGVALSGFTAGRERGRKWQAVVGSVLLLSGVTTFVLKNGAMRLIYRVPLDTRTLARTNSAAPRGREQCLPLY